VLEQRGTKKRQKTLLCKGKKAAKIATRKKKAENGGTAQKKNPILLRTGKQKRETPRITLPMKKAHKQERRPEEERRVRTALHFF